MTDHDLMIATSPTAYVGGWTLISNKLSLYLHVGFTRLQHKQFWGWDLPAWVMMPILKVRNQTLRIHI